MRNPIRRWSWGATGAGGVSTPTSGQRPNRLMRCSSRGAVKADWRLFLRMGRLERQKYVEDCSAATATCTGTNANRTAMLQNDSTCDPQSQSGAVLSLSGEKGLEYLLAVSR